uniref:ABC transporter domain-containing protein n=1 Tax=Bionectria ochroleuca TaxID=29856 RepID=A0A8H7KBA5_BIOOC
MAAVYLLATTVTAPLSWFEHTKTIKPSLLICPYLILSALLDSTQIRTFWTRLDDNRALVALFTASYGLRAIILLMESLPKNLTREADKSRSPEDKCGVISRSLFLWMIPLLYKGYRQSLGVNDLYAPPVDAAPADLEEKLWRGWSNSDPGAKYRLLSVTAKALLPRLLAPIIPRLCVVGFMVAQPVLLSHLIQFLSDNGDSRNDGSNFLAAYALVYIGLAIANAWYFHQNFKFITCVRGGLVALVYDRTMSLRTYAIDKSSAVTVMSADIERITIGLKNIHDLWANVIQVALAAWLLERQTGVAIILPLLVAASCGYGTLKISAAAGGQQANWLKRIEKRVDVTNRTLSSMRGIKVSGFANTLIDVIQSLRSEELKAASKFRWWQVGALVMGFFPVMISPVLTLAIFIFAADRTSQPLDASRMFVSLSTLTIMSQPLSVLFQSGPMISSMIACFDRIGRFIETQEGLDIQDSPHSSTEEDTEGDVKILNGSFGWSVDSASVLKDVNVTLPRGELTMIIGPVGCGKSTLLKGLLGEVTYANGVTMLPRGSLGFCDQTPWIVNGTVEENITMFSSNDNEYYNTMLEACALLDDLKQLSDGDQSKVGSKGIALSGGQKQRVSLARTLFARRNINLFDDILSGLDSTTASHVFAAVFGPTGLLRRNKSTTILATHSIHFLPYADHIICIGPEGNIVQQGSFTELSAVGGYVSSLGIKNNQSLLSYINPKVSNGEAENNSKTKTPEPDGQNKSQKPRGVYRYYFKSIGYGMSLLYLVLATIYTFLFTFPYLWAKWWTDANSRDPWQYTEFYMGATLYYRHAVITIVNTSGLSLHQKLISTALHAPLSFFEKTDTGITLNRFSQDLQMVDNELPLAALNIACSGLILIGRMLLIMNTSYWLVLSFSLIILALGALQSVYMSTSRQLRHLDLETKSPLYSQFVESLDGLASIRAFGWQGPFKELMYRNLDRSQRPFYLLLVLQRWLSVSLDCLTAAFVILIGALMITMRDQISPGFAGVALANLIGLSGSMSTVVETWTHMETSMTSIQRIRDFERDVPSETRGYSQTAAPRNGQAKVLLRFKT